jgi:hypothetical protein
MMKHILTTAVAGFSIAATIACGNANTRNNSATDDTMPARTAPAADQQSRKGEAVNLTGCLQEGKRGTYILTRLNEPAQRGVGTSGDGIAVEREQLREAANAYRVEAKNQVDMEEMLGKQVRVTGVVSKGADLPSQPTATNGTGRDDTREKIDQGDLAKIDADSVTVVADNCGGRNDKSR